MFLTWILGWTRWILCRWRPRSGKRIAFWRAFCFKMQSSLVLTKRRPPAAWVVDRSPSSYKKEFFLCVLRPYHHRHQHQRHRRHHHRHRRHHHPIHKLPSILAPIYSADSSSGKDSNIQPFSHKISFALAKKNKDRLAKKNFLTQLLEIAKPRSWGRCFPQMLKGIGTHF